MGLSGLEEGCSGSLNESCDVVVGVLEQLPRFEIAVLLLVIVLLRLSAFEITFLLEIAATSTSSSSSIPLHVL